MSNDLNQLSLPQRGGSFTRQPDGALDQNDGSAVAGQSKRAKAKKPRATSQKEDS